jgi:hypothetical protein
MAARKDSRIKTKHREAIQTSMLINRLSDHILGEVEMTSTQIRAAQILLNKSLPDLRASDDTITLDGDLSVRNVIKEYVDGRSEE